MDGERRVVRGAGRRAAVAAAIAMGVAAGGVEAQQADSTRRQGPDYELQEVVVSAAGFEQARINAPASITVLTPEVVSRQRNSSLAELLAHVEGIDVGDRVGKTGGLSISMRGMPSDYTLILIDGRRQNAAGNVTPNGFGDTSSGFLPPVSSIERVEVIRGPMSTLYGSDAMGGVVNIITRRVGEHWRGTLSTDATFQEEAGFGNIYSGNASMNGPILPDLLGLSLRGSLLHRRESELQPTGEFGEAVEISRRGPSPVEADIYSLGGRLTLTPSADHDVWLEVDRARQIYDNSQGQLGTLDRPEDGFFRGYGPEQRFHRDQATLAHNWRFGGGTVQSSLMRNSTETLGRTLPTGTPGGPPGSGLPEKPAGAPRTLESTNTVLDAKLVQHLGDHMVSVGGQWWDAEMVDGVALEPFEHTQWSLFAEDQWQFARSLALTVGLRRDAHSAFGSQISPRGYLVWNAARDWTLKGGVSRGYKTPRVEQLVDGIIGFSGQGTIALIGTPSLKPETSTSTELGAYYNNLWGLSASFTLFHNRFTDKITSGTPVPNCSFALAPDLPGCVDYGDFPAQESFRQSVNVDEAVTQGVEASAGVPLGRIWSASGNYTYTWSEQLSGENEGMPLSNTPRHMLNATLRAQTDGPLSGWLRGEYRSSRARRTTIAPDPAYEALGDYKAYGLFHLGASYEVNPLVTVSATVYNLLNTDFLRYADYQGPVTEENPSGVYYTNVYNNHQEGRRLWISTSVRF